ncbi:MAG: CpaD family pilus assembly lipoprotein [Alphaproteobacteria bacterium]|nr:CpaD family pilus assembly lipoprotein [Alphaproteobacteria bacterium]
MRPITLILLVAGLLTACGPTQTRSDVELRREPIFDTITDSAEIAPGLAGDTALDLLLARNDARYGDRLVVTAPAETRESLRRRLAATGVRVLPAPEGETGPNKPYRATFVRLIVTPPSCGDWSDEADFDNKPDAHWGCSQTSNLARMVADPNDLLAGRETIGPQGTAADILAIRAYRQRTIKWVPDPADAATVGD